MPAPLTMEQIARELNLSRVTVSSVINDRFRERGISETTALRVRDYLAKRGYVPSRSAVDLRTGVRSALGILYGGRLYSHLIEAFNELVGHIGGCVFTGVCRGECRSGLGEDLTWPLRFGSRSSCHGRRRAPQRRIWIMVFSGNRNRHQECPSGKEFAHQGGKWITRCLQSMIWVEKH